MAPKSSTSSAKQFLLDQLLKQAVLDGISFSDFELGLLRQDNDDPSINHEALADFELRKRDEFLDNVGSSLQRARDRFEGENKGNRHFWEAIGDASEPDDYLAIILWDRFNDELLRRNPLESRARSWQDNLLTLGVVVTLVTVLLGSFLYWADNSQRWLTAWQDFLSRHPSIASIRLPYMAWLQDPGGWFQRDGGKYLVLSVVALGVAFWGRFLLRLASRVSGRDKM